MDRRGEEQDDEEGQQLGGSSRVAATEPNKWPTVDGPLGLSGEESVAWARRFFRWGFALLPFLWAVNCYYFWPILRNREPSPPSYFKRIRPHVVRSAIGFTIFSVLLTSWSLMFMIGGERLFGPWWNNFVMYNLADKLGLTGWT